MDSPVEKGTAVPKSPASAKKVRTTTPGFSPAQDIATKPAKQIKKKKPKMQELDDEPSKADSAQGSHSKLQEPPQQVNNQVLKTHDANKSPNKSAPDVGGQDKFKALNPQGRDSAKKVIKKKGLSPPAQLDDKDEKSEQTQKPIDQGETKKLRLPAKQSSPDNFGQTDQLKKKVKKGTEKAKRPDSQTLINEEPEKVEQLKQDIEKTSQKFKPSVSQIDDAPIIIKKKIKRPTPPPASESESESESEPESEPEPEHEDEVETGSEHEGEQETGSEHEGEEETGSEHDNDMDGDEEYESDDENESEEEVEKAPEDEASEEDEEDDEGDDDEHKHGREEEDRDDDAAKTDDLGNENAEKRVHDTPGLVAVVAEPERIFSYDVAQDKGDVSGEAHNASGQAQDKADDVATESKGALGEVQNAVGSLAKESVHATEEAANKLSLDPVKGLIGKNVNDAGEVIDDSGKKLGKATADYPPMAENSINDAGEITDTGEVVNRVSQVEELQGQAGIDIKGFKPGMEQNGSVNAHGIQIKVQSTKDGVNVTINIPGVFQQQQ